jgi:hypothetical protein
MSDGYKAKIEVLEELKIKTRELGTNYETDIVNEIVVTIDRWIRLIEREAERQREKLLDELLENSKELLAATKKASETSQLVNTDPSVYSGAWTIIKTEKIVKLIEKIIDL